LGRKERKLQKEWIIENGLTKGSIRRKQGIAE